MDPRAVIPLVLAAGEGRRMGGRPKADLRVGEETFLERILRTSRETGLGPPIVVRGAAAFDIPPGVISVDNPAPERGMLSSVHCGLGALPRSAAGVLLWPVDCPRVPARVLAALVAAAAGGAPIVVPRHAGRRGHPVFFAARVVPDLLAAPADQGARAVVRAHGDAVVEVDVDAPEVLDDFDSPSDLP